MGYSVTQECPQCGGSITLDETDRLISCPYCGVSSFIANNDPFRFVLPAKQPEDNILYAPYIRFRGLIFTCQGSQVTHKLLDVTHKGYSHNLLPLSLGFRPQTQKMQFIGPKFPGAYLPCQLGLEEALDRINANPLRRSTEGVLHSAHIGDSFSFIYLPLVIKNGLLHDMVTDSSLGKIDESDKLFSIDSERPNWQPVFLATLCPQCGWNLEGEKDSLVLFCRNCESAWETMDSSLKLVPHSTTIFSKSTLEDSLLLPFWRLEVVCEGTTELKTFADFLKITNQPRLTKPEWEFNKLFFISPAFKIRPKSYLRLADQMTLAQHKLTEGQSVLPFAPHPVNLSKSEAEQSLKIILASTAVAKKNLMPLLPDINFKILSTSLMLIPFRDNIHGYYQDDLKINVNKKSLELGRHL